jgi:hypothetical protein
MSYRSFTAVSVIVLLTLLSGCGKKTPLVPPQKLVPERINDLRYFLDEQGVTLKWSYPTKMENGDALKAIESFEIYRAVIPQEEFCRGCPVLFEEPVEIDGGYLPASGDIRTAAYTEENLQNGNVYFFKVRSRAGWWYPSGDSNVVSFVRGLAPKAPQGLRVEAGDRSLAISWNQVTENIEGKPLENSALYQIYRRSGNEVYSPLGKPLQEPKFIDAGLLNEVMYTYKVRALVAYGDTLQTGAASQEVSGVPRDLTPPPQPQHLMAVAISDGVKLVWQAVAVDDLNGYRIYRREEKTDGPLLIAEVGPEQNQYIDRSIKHGRKLFYTVTAFDRAQPVNESLPVAEVIVDLR